MGSSDQPSLVKLVNSQSAQQFAGSQAPQPAAQSANRNATPLPPGVLNAAAALLSDPNVRERVVALVDAVDASEYATPQSLRKVRAALDFLLG